MTSGITIGAIISPENKVFPLNLRKGHVVNIKRVSRQMSKRGIQAIYQKPNLSKPKLRCPHCQDKIKVDTQPCLFLIWPLFKYIYWEPP